METTVKPYTFYMQLEREQKGEIAPQRTNGASSAIIAQPEIARAVANIIQTITTGVTVFGSSAAVISAITLRQSWTAQDVLQVSLGVAGTGLLIRTIALSKSLLVWVEMLTNRDIDRDGFIGHPEPEPDAPPFRAMPVSNGVLATYNNARALWTFTWRQIKAAGGVVPKQKPWSRRVAVENVARINKENWRDVIGLWIESHLIRDEQSREIATLSHRKGIDMLDKGMIMQDYMRVDGSWVSKKSEEVEW